MLCIRGTSHGPVSVRPSVCLSICLSVRLSQAGVLLKRQNVDSRDEGKHTGRNDLLYVKKMMWMGERV